jgi:hypothetical protein
VLVLLVWAAAVVAALVILGVLGYELLGHVRRLLRAAAAARSDLLPRLRVLDQLRPQAGSGRHRAGVPRA